MNKHFVSNVFRLAVLALAMVGSSGVNAASVSTDAKGTVIAPIQIAKGLDLSFGNFAAGTGAGTVTIAAAGGARTGSGVTLSTTGAGAAGGAGRFDVSGQAGLGYTISLTPTLLTREGGSETMSFTVVSDIATGTLSGTTGTGTQSFFVGGVLSVNANQLAGNYIGSVSATVEYQ